MKTLLFSKFTIIFGVALASALSARHFAPSLQQHVLPNSISAITQSMAAPQPDQLPVNDPTEPQAIEVREDELSDISIATVRVPDGDRQIARESFDDVNDRVGLAIGHVTALGITIAGTTPTSGARPSTEVSDHHPQGNTNDRQPPEEKDVPHVGGTSDQPPPKVVSGQTNFALISTTQPSAPQTFFGPGGTGPLAATPATDNGSTTTPRTVTESDIWKIRGHTLYFFNQLRGLQIIDITNPDAPARIAKLPLRRSVKRCTSSMTRTFFCSRKT